MIHLYWGDGKGKTTAAMGLALRAAGQGLTVVVAQFLKPDTSGERAPLAALPNVHVLPSPPDMKFTSAMSEAEKEREAVRQTALLQDAFRLAGAENAALLVLDELCDAVSLGMVRLALALALLDGRGTALEVVLTGHTPHPDFLTRADYCTEMRKHRHPFDGGITARRGIEW